MGAVVDLAPLGLRFIQLVSKQILLFQLPKAHEMEQVQGCGSCVAESTGYKRHRWPTWGGATDRACVLVLFLRSARDCMLAVPKRTIPVYLRIDNCLHGLKDWALLNLNLARDRYQRQLWKTQGLHLWHLEFVVNGSGFGSSARPEASWRSWLVKTIRQFLFYFFSWDTYERAGPPYLTPSFV